MTFRRMSTAVLVGAAAMALAPTATADEADTRNRVVTIQSAARPSDVWDQSNWSGHPTIAYPRHGELNQQWEVIADSVLRERRDGLCATAEGDRVVGRGCTGAPDQRWFGLEADNPRIIVNHSARACATFDGSVRQLLLRPCDRERADQTWNVVDR